MPPESWWGKLLSLSLGAGIPTWGQKFNGPFPAALAGAAFVDLEGFGELELHGKAGVEACHGFLEDHGDVLARDFPALLF